GEPRGVERTEGGGRLHAERGRSDDDRTVGGRNAQRTAERDRQRGTRREPDGADAGRVPGWPAGERGSVDVRDADRVVHGVPGEPERTGVLGAGIVRTVEP